MSLIAMAVYCTEENRKDRCLASVLRFLGQTNAASIHNIYFCVNGMTELAEDMLRGFCKDHRTARILYMPTNVGTAKAINAAWRFRKPGENCIKMDDDICVYERDWVEQMERAITADPLIGQVGLKRKDCWEWPGHEHPDWRSGLRMLPHIPGERWQIVEKVKHVIGSCVMHSSALLDKVGYLYQPSLYGYDDVIMSHRSYIAGFYSCFLPHINIDHIDDGKTPYQGWKEKHSAEQTQGVIDLVHEMINGTKSIYYGPQD